MKRDFFRRDFEEFAEGCDHIGLQQPITATAKAQWPETTLPALESFLDPTLLISNQSQIIR